MDCGLVMVDLKWLLVIWIAVAAASDVVATIFAIAIVAAVAAVAIDAVAGNQDCGHDRIMDKVSVMNKIKKGPQAYGNQKPGWGSQNCSLKNAQLWWV